jgi:hypothetical protein
MSQTPTTVPNIAPSFLGGGVEAMPNTRYKPPQNLDEIKL